MLLFAFVGIGEYVHDASPENADLSDKPNDRNSNSSHTTTEQQTWTVSDNAVLLHRADPLHIAQAIYSVFLVSPSAPSGLPSGGDNSSNISARQRLMQETRMSLGTYFTPARQMAQYAVLYASVVRARRAVV